MDNPSINQILNSINQQLNGPNEVNMIIAKYAHIGFFDLILKDWTTKNVTVIVDISLTHQYRIIFRRDYDYTTYGEIKRQIAEVLKCQESDIRWMYNSYYDNQVISCDNILYVASNSIFIFPTDSKSVKIYSENKKLLVEFPNRSIFIEKQHYHPLIMSNNSLPSWNLPIISLSGYFRMLSMEECFAIDNSTSGDELRQLLPSDFTTFDEATYFKSDYESFKDGICRILSSLARSKNAIVVTHVFGETDNTSEFDGVFEQIEFKSNKFFCSLREIVYLAPRDFIDKKFLEQRKLRDMNQEIMFARFLRINYSY